MTWWAKPVAIGVALALLTAGILYTLPAAAGKALLAVILAVTAGVYIGIGLMVNDLFLTILETAAAVFFASLALLGLKFSPFILALGYFLHGLWDVVHHPRYLRSPGPWWYQPLCLTYDWMVAVVILARWGI